MAVSRTRSKFPNQINVPISNCIAEPFAKRSKCTRAQLAIAALILLVSLSALAQTHAVDPAPASQPGDSSSTPAAPNAAPQASQGIVRIVPFGRGSGAITKTSAPFGAHLTYWGGPVISQIHVVAVFWGPNVNTTVTAGIGQFFTDITSSRFYDLLTEYSTVGVTGSGVPAVSSNQAIVRGVFDTAVTITPSVCPGPAACSLSDAQIQTELTAQINAGHLPQPVSDPAGNVNSFYMIYFPPGVSISLDATTHSCVAGGFCAYHSNTPNVNPLLRNPYGVLPDFAPPSGCANGCGGGTLFQNVTAVTSHEMSEAVTDAQVGTATVFGPPLAWYDPNNAEIADICTAQDVAVAAGGHSYTVQQDFSNLQGDCISAPPVLNLTVPAGGVAPAVSFNLPLTIQSSAAPFTLSGYTGTVHFTSADATAVLPADYTFTAADAGTHSFPVTLGTLGDQTITVTDTHSAGFVGSATINVNKNPDLVISKTHTGDFIAGQTGAYTITVSNSGHGPTAGTVTVTDTLPSGLTATAIIGTGWTCVLNTLTCTRADALPLASNYPAIILAVNAASNAPTQVTNTATVAGGGETNTANDTASDVTNINSPDMIVTKSHAGVINGSFFQGETGATYTLNVINNGSSSTTAPVSVVDTLPAGLTATAISGTGWTCTLANLTCTRSDVLAAGQNYPFITVTVNVALNAPANVTNVATVSGGGESNTTNDVAQDLTIVLPPPTTDMSISMFNPVNFIQGQPGAYIIGVFNVGTLDSTGTVTVTDMLPAGLTATAMAGTNWNCNVLTLTCTRSDVLAFGSTYPSITLNVNVDANAPLSVTNTVTVSGGGDSTPANNSASDATPVAVPLIDLGFTFGPGAFAQGQTGVTFAVIVQNLGNVPSSGLITVTQTLGTGFTPTALSGTGWTCTLASMACTTSSAINGGAFANSIVVTGNVAGNAPGTIPISATVSGGGDANAANNTATSANQVFPAISISPITGTLTVNAGQPAQFSAFVNLQNTAGTVTFTCSGLPTGTACSFNPSSDTLVATQVSMTVTTTSRTASVSGGSPRSWPGSPVVVVLILTGLLALAASRTKKRRLRIGFALASTFLLCSLLGCGSKTTTTTVTQNPNGTQAGTYSITMTATGSSAGVTNQVFTLVVR